MPNLLFLWHPYHLHPTLDNKLNKWVIFFEVFHLIGIISIHSTYLFSIPKELSEKSIEEKTVCSYESHRISEMPPFLLMWELEQKRRHESKCFFLLCHLACIGDHPNITSAKRWKDVGCWREQKECLISDIIFKLGM